MVRARGTRLRTVLLNYGKHRSWPAACFVYAIETPEQTIARMAREIELLKQKVDFLTRKLFGAKSEKIDEAQLKLLLGEAAGKDPVSSGADAPEEAAGDGADKPKRKRGGHRSRITGLDKLPVEIIEMIPDFVRNSPDEFERCGEQVTEQLDVVPARYVRKRFVRPVFRRKTARHLPPVVAPAPPTPLVGGLPSAGLLAHVMVGKYVDHLPLYRQQDIFRRAGLGIPRDLIIQVPRCVGVGSTRPSGCCGPWPEPSAPRPWPPTTSRSTKPPCAICAPVPAFAKATDGQAGEVVDRLPVAGARSGRRGVLPLGLGQELPRTHRVRRRALHRTPAVRRLQGLRNLCADPTRSHPHHLPGAHPSRLYRIAQGGAMPARGACRPSHRPALPHRVRAS